MGAAVCTISIVAWLHINNTFMNYFYCCCCCCCCCIILLFSHPLPSPMQESSKVQEAYALQAVLLKQTIALTPLGPTDECHSIWERGAGSGERGTGVRNVAEQRKNQEYHLPLRLYTRYLPMSFSPSVPDMLLAAAFFSKSRILFL